MKYRYDKQFKGIFCSPNSADEWMELIRDIGFDYDGCNTVESLKGLVDELVEMSVEARKCLHDGKLFYDEVEDNKSLEEAIAEKKRWENAEAVCSK